MLISKCGSKLDDFQLSGFLKWDFLNELFFLQIIKLEKKEF